MRLSSSLSLSFSLPRLFEATRKIQDMRLPSGYIFSSPTGDGQLNRYSAEGVGTVRARRIENPRRLAVCTLASSNGKGRPFVLFILSK